MRSVAKRCRAPAFDRYLSQAANEQTCDRTCQRVREEVSEHASDSTARQKERSKVIPTRLHHSKTSLVYPCWSSDGNAAAPSPSTHVLGSAWHGSPLNIRTTTSQPLEEYCKQHLLWGLVLPLHTSTALLRSRTDNKFLKSAAVRSFTATSHKPSSGQTASSCTTTLQCPLLPNDCLGVGMCSPSLLLAMCLQ